MGLPNWIFLAAAIGATLFFLFGTKRPGRILFAIGSALLVFVAVRLITAQTTLLEFKVGRQVAGSVFFERAHPILGGADGSLFIAVKDLSTKRTQKKHLVFSYYNLKETAKLRTVEMAPDRIMICEDKLKMAWEVDVNLEITSSKWK